MYNIHLYTHVFFIPPQPYKNRHFIVYAMCIIGRHAFPNQTTEQGY